MLTAELEWLRRQLDAERAMNQQRANERFRSDRCIIDYRQQSAAAISSDLAQPEEMNRAAGAAAQLVSMAHQDIHYAMMALRSDDVDHASRRMAA